MAVSIIDLLEIVDIEQRKLKLQAIAAALLQQCIQVFVEGLVVVEPGQRIDLQQLVRNRPLHQQ
ncbi:hypothetical protein D3C76_1861610 [compost metagenome]